MPFIHIKSNPPKRWNISSILDGIQKDFSKGTGIDTKHITVTWEYFENNHFLSYSKVLIDLLAPDTNDEKQIERMLQIIAESIANRAKVTPDTVFINYREAKSGMVYDAENVVKW